MLIEGAVWKGYVRRRFVSSGGLLQGFRDPAALGSKDQVDLRRALCSDLDIKDSFRWVVSR